MYEYPSYDDFYKEPSEFDMQIEEFKQSLRKFVSEEWIDKMNALEKENAELQEVKKNFEQIKNDYEIKKNECELKMMETIESAEHNARHLRLKELMEDVQYTFFIPCFTAIRGKKCDKCDKDRMIHYKSPQGKDAKELCSCGEPIEIMDFKCLVLYEFALKENGSKINMWFKAGKTGNDNYYTPTQCLTDYIIVEEDTTTEDFKSFDEDESFCFRTQEKCQEYCDWYNKNVLGIDIKDIQEGKQ